MFLGCRGWGNEGGEEKVSELLEEGNVHVLKVWR